MTNDEVYERLTVAEWLQRRELSITNVVVTYTDEDFILGNVMCLVPMFKLLLLVPVGIKKIM